MLLVQEYCKICISIHPLRAEWDRYPLTVLPSVSYFNPPTPCGVGLGRWCPTLWHRTISIHPLRAEWDP